jgi:hypothetical protein
MLSTTNSLFILSVRKILAKSRTFCAKFKTKRKKRGKRLHFKGMSRKMDLAFDDMNG